MDLLKVAYKVPNNAKTFEIKSGDDVLVIREPFASDYMFFDEIKKESTNTHARYLKMAMRLTVSWNGKPGVSPVDLGSLTREGYRTLTDHLNQFQLDIVPQSALDLLPNRIKELLEENPNSGVS